MNPRLLLILVAALALLMFAIEFVLPGYASGGSKNTGFYALMALVGGVFVILGGRLLRALLWRPATYFDAERGSDA